MAKANGVLIVGTEERAARRIILETVMESIVLSDEVQMTIYKCPSILIGISTLTNGAILVE